jgi:hypothetical protein
MEYYKAFVTEFGKALKLYSKVFFGTILISIVAFYIYGTIKESHVAQDAVVTAFSYLVTLVLISSIAKLAFRRAKDLFETIVEHKHTKDEEKQGVAGIEFERVNAEMEQLKRVLAESLKTIQGLEIRHEREPAKEVPSKIEEWNRVKHHLIEHIDPNPRPTYNVITRLLRWYGFVGTVRTVNDLQKESGKAQVYKNTAS